MSEGYSNKITTVNSNSSRNEESNKNSMATPLRTSGKSTKKSQEINVKVKRNYIKNATFKDQVFFGSSEVEKQIRYDREGNEINPKNKKKVKVTFCDNALGQPLVEEINIESYKEYNVVGFAPPEKEVYGKTNTCCSCNVF